MGVGGVHARKREVRQGSIEANLSLFDGCGEITPAPLKRSRNPTDRRDLSVRRSDSFQVTRRDLMIVGATADQTAIADGSAGTRIPMTIDTSDCLLRFGHADFDPDRLAQTPPSQCPVRGCGADLLPVRFGKSKEGPRYRQWCQEHGLRLHTKTFAYWNGPGREDDARLRNVMVRPELARAVALGKGMKAESHRLGYEMSEDALSWNVFVSLADAGKLRAATKYLTGRELRSEPRLYLWGRPVAADADHSLYGPLQQVRYALEPDIHTYVTEPDIMLIADGEMLVSIEAKFGSGNPLAHEGTVKRGEKPITAAGLLERYLGTRTSEHTRRIVQLKHIGPTPCTQLLRNVVFAAEMAGDTPWHVVNLVAESLKGRTDKHKSFDNPTEEVVGYLHSDYNHCFTYRTWEGLYANCIAGDPKLAEVGGYLRGKSAHYFPAFTLS
jgi:hypothetical protein